MGKAEGSIYPEFRQQMVALVREVRTQEELSPEFEPSVQATRYWVRQSGAILTGPSYRRSGSST